MSNQAESLFTTGPTERGGLPLSYRPWDFLPREPYARDQIDMPERSASVTRIAEGDPRAEGIVILAGGRDSAVDPDQRLLYRGLSGVLRRAGFLVVGFYLGRDFTYNDSEPVSDQTTEAIMRNCEAVSKEMADTLEAYASWGGRPRRLNVLATSASAAPAAHAVQLFMGTAIGERSIVRMGLNVPSTHVGNESRIQDYEGLKIVGEAHVAATRNDHYFPWGETVQVMNALGSAGVNATLSAHETMTHRERAVHALLHPKLFLQAFKRRTIE